MAKTPPAKSDAVTIVPIHGLSFAHYKRSKRGRHIDGSTSYFTGEPKNYGDGWKDGRLAAIEYLDLAFASRDHDLAPSLIAITKDIAKIIAEPFETGDPPSLRGKAVGFLRTLEAMLIFAAKNCDYRNYIEAQIAQSDEWEAKDAARKAAERRAFAERMKAARERKRGERQAAGEPISQPATISQPGGVMA